MVWKSTQLFFEKTDENNNLYLKIEGGKWILLAQIFFDYIIFGGQNALHKTLANEMMKEFEMSMFGEIKFFVGLQVYQMKYCIYIT